MNWLSRLFWRLWSFPAFLYMKYREVRELPETQTYRMVKIIHLAVTGWISGQIPQVDNASRCWSRVRKFARDALRADAVAHSDLSAYRPLEEM